MFSISKAPGKINQQFRTLCYFLSKNSNYLCFCFTTFRQYQYSERRVLVITPVTPEYQTTCFYYTRSSIRELNRTLHNVCCLSTKRDCNIDRNNKNCENANNRLLESSRQSFHANRNKSLKHHLSRRSNECKV